MTCQSIETLKGHHPGCEFDSRFDSCFQKKQISPSLVSAAAVNGLHPVPHSVPPFLGEVADKPPFNSSLSPSLAALSLLAASFCRRLLNILQKEIRVIVSLSRHKVLTKDKSSMTAQNKRALVTVAREKHG